MKSVALNAITITSLLWSVISLAASTPEPQLSELEQLITGEPPVYLTQRPGLRKLIVEYYEKTGFEPGWIESGRSTDQARSLLETLDNADQHGLVPGDYEVNRLRQEIEQLTATDAAAAGQVAALDLRLSFAFMQYAADLHAGRIDPKMVDPLWVTTLTNVDYAQAMQSALRNGEVAATLQRMAPQHAGYQRLQQSLATLRERFQDHPGWPKVSTGKVLEVGDASPRVIELRRRLAASGELVDPQDSDTAVARDSAGGIPEKDSNAGGASSTTATNPPAAGTAQKVDPQVYDKSLAEAVKTFQRRHGLLVDGLLGPGTVEALNVSPQERIRQVVLNLERWRWLPSELGDRYVLVNIPDYRVFGYDQGQQVVDMKVIVGKEYDDAATPIFTDLMQHVVFRPYWNIPHSIAADEILPEARKNHGYLAQKNYQIVADYSPDARVYPVTAANLARVASGDLRLRETPGPSNSLGLVKFIFPNNYAVYLHDTPADHLFSKDKRALSHGCIRVERPIDFAEFVFSPQPEWTRTRIDNAMHRGGRELVELNEPLPVYILYWTSIVGDDGEVQFRPDLYGYDEKLDQALEQATAGNST